MSIKYIRMSNGEFYLFPDYTNVYHKHMALLVAAKNEVDVTSAGFCSVDLKKGTVQTWGKSESLGISSRPEDSRLLEVFLSS